MDQIYIKEAFGNSGNTTAVPFTLQPDGTVSFNQGYPIGYELDRETDPNAKAIERDKTNWLYLAMTQTIKQYQENGIPEFIKPADNGGVAFSYGKDVIVKYRNLNTDPFIVYVSKVAANVDLPTVTASWQPVVTIKSTNAQAIAGTDDSSIMTPLRVKDAILANSTPVAPPGSFLWHCVSTPPTGYLKCNGTAVSRTTYAALFAVIGIIYGAGDGSTTFNLPDVRGRFVRAFVDGGSIDSGRVFASVQADDFKTHTHVTNVSTTANVNASASSSGAFAKSVVAAATTEATGGTESRPVNIALLACIKT